MGGKIGVFAFIAAVVMQTEIAYAQWNERMTQMEKPRLVTWVDSDFVFIKTIGDDYTVEKGGDIVYEMDFFDGSPWILKKNTIIDWRSEDIILRNRLGVRLDSIPVMTLADTGLRTISTSFLLVFDLDHWMIYLNRMDGTRQVMHTANGGDAWNSIQTAINLDDNTVFDGRYEIQMIDFWAWMISPDIPDTMFRTKDFGVTWERIALPTCPSAQAYRSFAFANKELGLMTCNNSQEFFMTKDGGETWSSEGLVRPLKQNWKLAYAKPTATKDGLFFLYGQFGCHYAPDHDLFWRKLDDKKHEQLSFYDAEHGISIFIDPNSGKYKYRFFEADLKTGLSEPGNNGSIEVYPNPASDYLNTTLSEGVAIGIYDVTGKQVRTADGFSSLNPLYIGDLKPGTYFLRVEEMGWLTILIKE